MVLALDRAGPANPFLSTPDRLPGSRRRTSSIDTSRPDGFQGGSFVDARARDLLSGDDGETTVVGAERLQLELAWPVKEIVSIESDAPVAGSDVLADLLGRVVGPGFRAHVVATLSEAVEAKSLRYLLADDLPGALLVSGYANQRAEALPPPDPNGPIGDHVRSAADICAGWAQDGTIYITFGRTGEVPTPMGPPAPALERSDDPFAWHEMEPLAPNAMRRRRRLDLIPTGDDGIWSFDQHFRDSHVDDDGLETVVHEYTVQGRVDARTETLLACEAEARVLPWVECPSSLASAGRLVGRRVTDLRREVREEFTGVTTCTHLNDTLRTLADLQALLRLGA